MADEVRPDVDDKRAAVGPRSPGVPATRLGDRFPTAVTIREVGPRDGLQLERPIPTEAKLEFIDRLVRAGSTRIEATSFVNPQAVPALADAADVVAAFDRWPDVEFVVLVAGLGGARRALGAGAPRLEFVVSVSESHSQANANKSVAEAVAAAETAIELSHGAGVPCEVILAMSFDCPFDGPTDPARVIELATRFADAGADRLHIADTVGTAAPNRTIDLCSRFQDALGRSPGLHLHDTRGLGLANALAAASIGVDTFDAAVGGLGGCPFAPGASGNVATEDLVHMLEELGIATGYGLGELREANTYLSSVLDKPLDAALGRVEPRLGFAPVARN
ncbi:MAG: hydroxymethylglutaryl-CoA lyase [Pseudoclavibacter sp.]